MVGAVLSLSYLALVTWLRWPLHLETVRSMALNEFGDFLAGVVGPLVLVWLILGFLQQGEELKQNTEALKLQADELNASVVQHKAMVEATRDQFAFQKDVHEYEREHEARRQLPRFLFRLPTAMKSAAVPGGAKEALWIIRSDLNIADVHNLRLASNLCGYAQHNSVVSRIDEFHVATLRTGESINIMFPDLLALEGEEFRIQLDFRSELENGVGLLQRIWFGYLEGKFRVVENWTQVDPG